MRYRVYCSNGHNPNYFYFDSKDQAKLVYNMAVRSELFMYVSFDEVYEESFAIKEWISEDVE